MSVVPVGVAGAGLRLDVPVGPGLVGDLVVPKGSVGVTLFAHGSGSSRLSPRNRFVAGELNARGIATFLFDLLTPQEELDRANVFDVELLGERLVETTRWLLEQPRAAGLRPCLFGASTGAAAALLAAARLGPSVGAVVSRGGRPDLAGRHLPQVAASTLLIVGGNDDVVLELNRRALAALTCERRLAIVRGASHLFQEPGALERVAVLAGDWLESHLTGSPGREAGPAETEVHEPLPTR